MRRFYLNTALPASQLPHARERLRHLQIDHRYGVEERLGLVAVMLAGGQLFDALSEAEAAQKVLRRAAPDLFNETAVAFVEVGAGARAPQQPATEQQPITPLTETKTVVSAEDDLVVSQLIEHTLRAMGVNIVTVHSGRAALEIIEDLEPDLVIIDLMMPDMHGWEVVQRMKANEVLQEIPVIILTALGGDQDRVFALTVAEVDDFIEKPVSTETLRQRVWAVLNR